MHIHIYNMYSHFKIYTIWEIRIWGLQKEERNQICHKKINKALGPGQVPPNEPLTQPKESVQQKRGTQ